MANGDKARIKAPTQHSPTNRLSEAQIKVVRLSGHERFAWLQLVEQRRLSTFTTMWQVPALALSAQAFLFTVALAKTTTGEGRLIAGAVGLASVLAAFQLFERHRQQERAMSRWLQAVEENAALPVLHARDELGKTPRFARLGRSPVVWRFAFLVVTVADIALVALACVQVANGWSPFS